MAKVGATKAYVSFIKGIITEASPLTFPENASIDEANFLLFRDGSRSRRLGMDLEDTFDWKATGISEGTFSNYAVSFFKWENAANDNTLSIGVIQVGPHLYFVDLSKQTLSTNFLNSGNRITVGVAGTKKYSFATINGWLVVATGETLPKVVQYTSSTDTMSQSTISIQVRDMWGVDDGLALSTRPGSLSTNHAYNIYNQGWDSSKASATLSALGGYPSNADIWILGKDENDNYSAAQMNKQYFGTTPAPKGRYILDAFNRGASRRSVTGLSSLPADKENGFPSQVAAYAGRLFYSGIISNVTDGDNNSPSYQGAVFYTKNIEKLADVGVCYQEADPTGEHVSELVDTDGGVTFILDAAEINGLVTKDRSLVVFSTQGIWAISGTGNVSTFIATDYGVAKVTTIGCIGSGSIVNAEGTLLYWAKGGVYSLSASEVSGDLQAQNITAQTIQTLINDVSDSVKLHIRSEYDEVGKTVRWLYTLDDAYDGLTFRNKFDRELVLDLTIGAFYVNTISTASTDGPYVSDMVVTANFVSQDNEEDIVVGSDLITAGGVQVIHTQRVKTRNPSFIKYLAFDVDDSNLVNFSFSLYRDTAFVDWASHVVGGVDYSSYIVTGYELHEDILRDKQVPHIFFYFKNTEESDENFVLENKSSCLVQVRWEWTGSSSSNRWGQQFQAYRHKRFITAVSGVGTSDGMDVLVSKSKLRGKGKAMSLKIESEAGKECHIYGWGLGVAGLTVP